MYIIGKINIHLRCRIWTTGKRRKCEKRIVLVNAGQRATAAKNETGLIIQMDGNLWAGNSSIPGDPNPQNKNGKLFENFVRVFEHHRSLGHNIIYSSEHFSKFPDLNNEELWELMTELFQGFDVKIVYTYRHYFSFLLSVFNEGHKQVYIDHKNYGWIHSTII